MPSSGVPADDKSASHEGEVGGTGSVARVVLLVDTHPTMQLWSEEVEALRDRIAQLGIGEVTVRPLDLSGVPAPDALSGAVLVLAVSNGASPEWHRAQTKRVLRAWSQQHPLAIAHVLPHPQWYRTGINPDPARLRRPGSGVPFSGWKLESTPAPVQTPTTEHTDLVPVPVVEFSDRSLANLALLITGEEQVRMAALLVPEPTDDAEPPAGDTDPKAVVDDFRASVSPTTFRLATYLAAVPLDLSLMQGIRSRLLPRSSTANLAEVLGSPMVHAQPQPGDSLHVDFAFASGIRTELLASARRSDIEQVVSAVGDTLPDTPGASTFTAVLDPHPATPPPLDTIDLAQRRDELAWRQVRAQVLLAMGGAHHQQGVKELAELPTDGLDAPGSSPLPSTPLPSAPTDSPSRSSAAQTPRKPRPAEGGPVSSKVQDPQPPAPGETTPPGAPITRSRAVIGDFPLRHPNFTGRGELLTALHESLRSGETTAVLPHALHGMGGVGKSLLAIEYIYRHQDDYDVIWWIPSERAAQIQSSLVELGQRLQLNAGNQANVAVPLVLDALSRGEPYRRWLLVYDNAESPEQVQDYLPRGGPGHVVITSRDARWTRWARPLEVNVFVREESKQLLQRRGPDITDAEADELADALGDLPLAIEQAAAWHAETGMPAQEYLRLLSEKQVELLDQPTSSDYPASVIAAWNVSLDQLEARNPAAVQLLQVCSFFAVAPIPRALFTAARSQKLLPHLDRTLRESIGFSRALRDISRYSLARIDHRTNAIQVHRLVQAALIARMSEEERTQIRDAAHRILAANDPDNPDSAEEYKTYGNLYPHVRASDAISSPSSWVRALVINETRYLYRWGDHDAAVRVGLEAHTAWTAAHGAEDAQTLENARWLGFHLFVVGRYAEAAELNAATLAAYERFRQAGHPDREGELQARTNVATDRLVQGEFAAALRIREEVHERAVRELGEDDPETLAAAHNLAVSLRLSGQFARARDLDQDAYERKVEMYGPDHPLTLFTRLGLLLDLRELGDYLSAERLSMDELSRAAFALGDLDPATLLARRLLAVAQRKAGHHEAARTTSELVCEQYRSRYHDTQHPDTMAAESGYAIDLRQVGDLPGAQRLGEDLVARYTQSLGTDHPHTLSAQVNLAITHRLRGEPRRALEIDSAAFDALVRRLGPDHPSTLVAATNLASDLHAVGDRTAALDRDQDTVPRLTAVLGTEHPTTLACESNLAIDLRATGRDEQAEEHFRHAATALENQLGARHPAVAQAESWDIRADCDLDLMPL